MSYGRTAQILAKQVGLFHGLNPEDVAKILSKGMTMHVRKGETIFYKDTTGNMMFVILEGQVGVFDGEKPIATLTAGDMFGEMALINNAPRSATAIAVTDTNLFTLSEEIFQRLLTKRVAVRILLNIVATLSKRLRETDRKLKEIETRAG